MIIANDVFPAFNMNIVPRFTHALKKCQILFHWANTELFPAFNKNIVPRFTHALKKCHICFVVRTTRFTQLSARISYRGLPMCKSQFFLLCVIMTFSQLFSFRCRVQSIWPHNYFSLQIIKYRFRIYMNYTCFSA